MHSEGDGLLFARGKKDLAETAQEFYWTIDLGIRKSHIKLDNFFTATRTGVGDFDGYGQIAVGRDFGCAWMEVGILESGVAETEAKG